MTDAGLHTKIDALTGQIAYLVERQELMEELIAEANPIIKAMMDAGIIEFAKWEKQGVFAFIKEMRGLFDQIITHYGPDDMRNLAEHVVEILDTVRNITQSDVLDMANEATDGLRDATGADPVGAWGVLRATKDEDVRKGLAVMVEVLRRVGRKANKGGEAAPPPRRALPAPVASTRPKDAPRAPIPQMPPAPVKPAACGVPSSDGFVEDWTAETGAANAATLGLEWTPERQAIAEWVRADYIATGVSPNVRRISKVGGFDMRQFYQLFPKGPAKLAAQVAGVPKPVGCI